MPDRTQTTKGKGKQVQMLKCKCGEIFPHYYAPLHRCPKPRIMVEGDLYAGI